ncbi:MAG: leucine--tRNA ligase, partial [Patescibacteria group bacterium]|nr:leucine--tRNA ligase [Patescibacteria group bacterium]
MQKKSKYNFKKVEQKWQKKWAKQNLYQTNEKSKKPKKYILVEFPYPSGFGLHIGHAFTNTGADIYARYQRMKGYNVLFPMGYDAFGLPTENYAIKNKLKPQDATRQNIAKFREQIKMLAFSFDMDREFSTTDPDYYKWTQWIFIQLYKKGLAYKKEMPINWCPSCKIGLANEEVVDGKCERCGAETLKKKINQWVLKITEYADRLADELDLTDFPSNVVAAQRNWIDRKEWIDITYSIHKSDEKVTVSTTRPDTNFGATFVVVAPEHPILDPKKGLVPVKYVKEVKAYVANALKKSELSRISEGRNKTGVFTGLYAVNQLNNQKMPVYVTDFVLMSVGTGAVVGVPGHDIRDFEFAQKFNIPIVRVVVGADGDTSEITHKEQVQEKEGTMVNSEFLDGMDIHSATKKIMDYLEEKGWGKKTIRYHLRDWIFSRQHYWGEPIPMVYCEKCGWNPVDEKDLPILLPDVENYEPTDTGESPLAQMHDWVKTKCPKCGDPAKRETDTMPNWAGSSWYYLRYIDPNNKRSLGDKKLLKKWMPVDVYIGGSEHTTLHLLYSRFWHKVLNDLDLAPCKEPYQKRVEHGVILGPDGKRMSKSTGNVLIPDDITQKFGVDATRTYLMFIGPFEGTMAWNERALKGICRFLDRFYNYISKSIKDSVRQDDDEVKTSLAKTIAKVSDCIVSFRFNTGVSSLMEMLNFLEAHKSISHNSIEKILKLLAPYAPY